MAGYQFFHVECYAREESIKGQTITRKKANGTFSSKEVAKEKRGNVHWIIAEAKREQGSCNHIDNPEAPVILLGNLDEVEAEAIAWAEQATDAQGRKLRKDAHCLLAGVISLPRSEEDNWENFKARSLNWLKEKYGDNLRCVIAHEKDEAHPHIHFYAVPKVGQSFDDIHEGKKAQKEIKKQNSKATKQQQNIAFSEAMRATQDDFSRKVGQRFGLTRIGPGRRRLTRAAWNAEQKQAEALREVEKTAIKRREHYKNEGLKAGKAQALKEAQRPLEKIGNMAKTIKTGLFTGWNQLTPAEQDAQRALKEYDKKLEAEKSKNRREQERLIKKYDARLLQEQEQRKKAEEAFDYVLKVGGSPLKRKLDKANETPQPTRLSVQERQQVPEELAPQEAISPLRENMPPAFNKHNKNK